MNNKGFAITTILYGLLILFCLLLVSLLGIMATYKDNLEKLIDNMNGSRDIITMQCVEYNGTFEEFKNSGNAQRGLYKFSGNDMCTYVGNSDLH